MDSAGIIPSFGNFAFTAIAFITALSVIVAIHEYGHYIVGRWSGIHAEVFSLGFGPVIYSRFDKHGTKWQIALLPFGGYVKFLGDANAASAGKDDEAFQGLTDAERRRTMHGAPLWARAATILAGPVFNFILSILVFIGLALSLGVSDYPPTIDKLYALPNQGITLQEGDKLLGINGTDYPPVEGYSDFANALPLQPLLDYTVLRDGVEVAAKGPPLSPSRIAAVTPDSAADEAGLLVGDVVIAINKDPVFEFNQMIPLVNNSGGNEISVSVWRAGEVLEIALKPEQSDIPRADNSFETRYIMGVNSSGFFTPATSSPGIVDAVKIGGQRTWDIVTLSLSGMYHMITGQISSCNMSGPVGIAKASGQMASQGIDDFIFFIALMSTAIGLMNLFPIPVLDGGHLVFIAYEAVTGREPNEKFVNALMMTGFVLLMSLMVFATTNDLFC